MQTAEQARKHRQAVSDGLKDVWRVAHNQLGAAREYASDTQKTTGVISASMFYLATRDLVPLEQIPLRDFSTVLNYLLKTLWKPDETTRLDAFLREFTSDAGLTWLQKTFDDKYDVMVDWLLLIFGVFPPNSEVRTKTAVLEDARRWLVSFGEDHRWKEEDFDLNALIGAADQAATTQDEQLNQAADLLRNTWIASLNGEYNDGTPTGLEHFIAQLERIVGLGPHDPQGATAKAAGAGGAAVKSDGGKQHRQDVKSCLEQVLARAQRAQIAAKLNLTRLEKNSYIHASMFNFSDRLNLTASAADKNDVDDLLLTWLTCLVAADARLQVFLNALRTTSVQDEFWTNFQGKHKIMVDWLLLIFGVYPPTRTLLNAAHVSKVPPAALKMLDGYAQQTRWSPEKYDTKQLIRAAASAAQYKQLNAAAQLLRNTWIASLQQKQFELDNFIAQLARIIDLNPDDPVVAAKPNANPNANPNAKPNANPNASPMDSTPRGANPQQSTPVSFTDQHTVLQLMHIMQANRLRHGRGSPRAYRPALPQVLSRRSSRRLSRSQSHGWSPRQGWSPSQSWSPSRFSPSQSQSQGSRQQQIAALMTRHRPDWNENENESGDEGGTLDGLFRQLSSRTSRRRSRPHSRPLRTSSRPLSRPLRTSRSRPRSRTGSKPKSRPRSRPRSRTTTGSKPRSRDRR